MADTGTVMPKPLADGAELVTASSRLRKRPGSEEGPHQSREQSLPCAVSTCNRLLQCYKVACGETHQGFINFGQTTAEQLACVICLRIQPICRVSGVQSLLLGPSNSANLVARSCHGVRGPLRSFACLQRLGCLPVTA